MDFTKSRELGARLSEVVPGGGHTYAKGADQFPELSPAVLVRGLGSHVWDADGNEFIEYGMGLRAGRSGPRLCPGRRRCARFARARHELHSPVAIELECAERFLGADPDGGDGEVHQGRFHRDERSTEARQAGDGSRHGRRLRRAPVLLVRRLVHRHHDDGWGHQRGRRRISRRRSATTTSTASRRCSPPPRTRSPPFSSSPPAPSRRWKGFLEGVRRLCTEHGAVLVFDEMITGFRYDARTAPNSRYGVVPDLSTFGKALANGFSLSALCGKREYMRLGSRERDPTTTCSSCRRPTVQKRRRWLRRSPRSTSTSASRSSSTSTTGRATRRRPARGRRPPRLVRLRRLPSGSRATCSSPHTIPMATRHSRIARCSSRRRAAGRADAVARGELLAHR